MSKPMLGFIGLGLMGAPIALKLLENGYPLTVWGRSPAKLEPALQAGASRADSPAALTAASDIVLLCVSDGAAVEDVVFGQQGIAENASTDKLLIDHSSISPEHSRRMAERLLSKTGMPWLDAPVSGGPPGVANKTLVVMAGGETTVFERALPVITSYAGRCTLMGPSGAGQSTKLINQALVGSNFAVLAEVTQLALNAGIDATKIPQALAGGRADSQLLQEYMPRMAQADFTPLGRIGIVLKDLEMVAALARETNTATPMLGLARELHRLLTVHGLSEADNAAAIQLYATTPAPEPT